MTWIVPLGVTILAAVAAFFIDRKDSHHHYEVEQFIVFCIYLIAIIISLAAWLIWAVVT
jgi:hypothetical protein